MKQHLNTVGMEDMEVMVEGMADMEGAGEGMEGEEEAGEDQDMEGHMEVDTVTGDGHMVAVD